MRFDKIYASDNIFTRFHLFHYLFWTENHDIGTTNPGRHYVKNDEKIVIFCLWHLVADPFFKLNFIFSNERYYKNTFVFFQIRVFEA